VLHPAAVEAVGVEAGGEPARRQQQLPLQPADDAAHHPLALRAQQGVMVGDAPPATGVAAQQQRVVVQHLLEVRHHPAGIDAVAGEATADLVVDAAARHRVERALGHVERAGLALHQQCVHQQRRRELRRSTETPVDRVELAAEPVEGAPDVDLRRRGRGGLERVRQVGGDGRSARVRLVAALPPGGVDRRDDLCEGRHAAGAHRRVVGAGEERQALRGEEDRHRPAAGAGECLSGFHEHRIEVGTLLTVDLDGDEVRVHQRRDVRVGERLVRHHVAPVAGGVADGKQDRTVGGPRLCERFGTPFAPVDRVVGVHPQVRGRGLS